jgi:hypothetical protein
MPLERNPVLSFNRGIISRYGLARTDLQRTGMAAEEMTNWMPRVLGSMMLRPGLGYLGSLADNAYGVFLPFIFSADDTAMLECTDSTLRFWIDDEVVARFAVTAAITNGTFTSDLSGWTDSDESGATSAWLAGGYMSLVGTGANAAIRDQEVTCNEPNVQHAVRIVVARGPVTLRIGATAGTDGYVSETTLGTGTHSLAFTPAGNFHIRLSNTRLAASLVDSVAVEASGPLELPLPWVAADLPLLRYDQSGDVMYVARAGYQQRKIERRATYSWSIVLFEPEDGPFKVENLTETTITPSGLTGDITLTASKSIFRSTHVGALFRLASTGQRVESALTGADQFSDPIRVVGTGAQRDFAVSISGTFVADVTLQYSVAEPGNWIDTTSTWTGSTLENFNDEIEESQVIYYRIGIKAGDYTSGTADVMLAYASGSQTGIVRITGYSSGTSVSAAVLDSLGGLDGTSEWWEGAWSDFRGWPSVVVLHEGRLWHLGKDKVYGSVSDAYESYDDTLEGDSGTIARSIGQGPVDSINWAVSLGRLMIGTAINSAAIAAGRIDATNPLAARSSSFDEPLTPTNFNLKNAAVRGVFVDRSQQRVYEIAYDVQSNDYVGNDLTVLVPDLNAAGISRIAVQHRPDVRVHCVREDGTVGVLIFDRAENVICWINVETDGVVEEVIVMPEAGEDRVYYVVRRTIDGATVRYLERWAREDECRGDAITKLADSFIVYDGAATANIGGLSHLEDETVVVWADGRDMGSHTVSAGQITLEEAVSQAVIGLGYTARWKSTKRAFAAALGTALTVKGRIDKVGLILADTHAQGLRFGADFDHLNSIPLADLPRITVDDEEVPDTDHVFEAYDEELITFPGSSWTTDSRVCLEAAAPRPAGVLACVVSQQKSG